MPIYDHECPACGRVFETYAGLDETEVPCSCGGTAKRIISVSGQFIGTESSPWLRSVLEVVDRDNPAKHVQDFVKNPTRANYKAWMKGEGIRPLDHTERGAPPMHHRASERDIRPIVNYLFERHRERKRVEVYSR